MTKNKLYTLLAIACFFGFIWLGFSFFADGFLGETKFSACLLKNITDYPCPSCGTTRSVKMLLFDGNLCGAFMMNPMGIIVAFIMVIVPIWLVFDLVSKKQTMLEAYLKIEKIISKRWIAMLLIILVILNWIWNINKQL